MAEMLCIQATTLKEIIDAIEASGCVTVRIQMLPSNAERYIISRELLVKVADEIRAFDGTTAAILVAELAARILGLAKEPDYNTTAILGKAILGFAILGNASDDGTTIKKLATPVIYLYDDTEEKPEVTTIKLATPVIELVVEDDSVENEPTIQKLTTPIIYLEVIKEEPEEPDEPDIPEPTVIQLTTPIIYLEVVEDETEEPEEPAPEPEPTIVQLDTPVIELVEVTDNTEEPIEPDVPTIMKLATPIIYLYDDDVTTIPYSINGDISSGAVVANDGTKKCTGLIPIDALANNASGWCVYLTMVNAANTAIAFYDSDRNFIDEYCYEDVSGYLSVQEITNLASQHNPVPVYVRFCTAIAYCGEGEDVVYVKSTYTPDVPVEPDTTTITKLATPIIYLDVA